MAITGLSKLPDWKGTCFRGARQPLVDFKKQYKVGKVINYDSFLSTSRDKSASEVFAKKNVKDTVGVMLFMKIKFGKDVSKLSLVEAEAEVLLLPGSSFKVDKIEKGKDFYEVTMKEQPRK